MFDRIKSKSTERSTCSTPQLRNYLVKWHTQISYNEILSYFRVVSGRVCRSVCTFIIRSFFAVYEIAILFFVPFRKSNCSVATQFNLCVGYSFWFVIKCITPLSLLLLLPSIHERVETIFHYIINTIESRFFSCFSFRFSLTLTVCVFTCTLYHGSTLAHRLLSLSVSSNQKFRMPASSTSLWLCLFLSSLCNLIGSAILNYCRYVMPCKRMCECVKLLKLLSACACVRVMKIFFFVTVNSFNCFVGCSIGIYVTSLFYAGFLSSVNSNQNLSPMCSFSLSLVSLLR